MTTLKNTLHDSNNGLDYTLVNDRYLPNLTVAAPTEHLQIIGVRRQGIVSKMEVLIGDHILLCRIRFIQVFI